MKILILNWKDLQHSKKGGAEEYVFQIAKYWMESGFDVKIMVPGHKKTEKCDSVSPDTLIHVGNSFSAHFFMQMAVSNLLRKWKPDIVIETVNTIPFFFVPKVISKRPGIRYLKLIFQTTEEVWNYELTPILGNVGKYVLEPLWLRNAAKYPIATISESSRLSLSKFGLRNIMIFPVGLDLHNETVDKNLAHLKKPDVVFCARLVQMKQPIDAIRAFLIARANNIEFAESKLHIIGDGPQLSFLKEKFSAEESLVFHGYIQKEFRDAIFRDSSFLLATSVREGWGLTVSESASFGVMPVGYRTPGLIDSISFAGGIVTEPNPFSLAQGLADAMLQIRSAPFTATAHLKDWSVVSVEILDSIISNVSKT
jgi:glycosyltransferase involved in cell wall biosynthesis